MNGKLRAAWMAKACAALVFCAITAVALPAQTLTTLFSFNGTDGANATTMLVQATDGSLYSTTINRGAHNGGTVFKITPSGTLTTLYNFCSQRNCADGWASFGQLQQAPDGSLYGTTFHGGAKGDGTVFKITPFTGTLTLLYTFCSQSGCTDGGGPQGLVQASDGNFYGTTYQGGANTNSECPYGCGTVFKITPNGTLTTLHSFNYTDGEYPGSPLVQATDGNLYGTTSNGGTSNNGTVFKVTLSGTLTTLHSFDGMDGSGPAAALVQAIDGMFYGTTYFGGADGLGTVFTISSTGMLTTLHSFDGTDGAYLYGGLVQATDGNFYGGTQLGGANDDGTIFKIAPNGKLTTLHNFDGTDGSESNIALVQATDGNFYGVTWNGGANGDGTVFRLSVGLKPFVKTEPTSGPVGTAVNILGTNLTTATGVTFNGTPAVFTVLSHSLITTTVPAGATTGKVQVTGSVGTGASNVPFRVLP